MTSVDWISLLTFPGVIVHEFAHQFFCHFTDVRVRKVCYFRLGNPAGYVVHEMPSSYIKMLLIDLGPFFINTLMSIIVFSFAIPDFNLLLIWLGLSIGMHAFPSSGDADALWKFTKIMLLRNPLVLLGLPIILLIKIVNSLRVFYLDLIYSVVLFLIVLGFV